MSGLGLGPKPQNPGESASGTSASGFEWSKEKNKSHQFLGLTGCCWLFGGPDYSSHGTFQLFTKIFFFFFDNRAQKSSMPSSLSPSPNQRDKGTGWRSHHTFCIFHHAFPSIPHLIP